ncbi:hypothetical protein CCACVL1_11558 [Corchorus capsularis]|uniref:Uncharacterized protein n=1 Tax=Corchorus capsularis TaxID=210143 RepID=A0A1R3IKK0_COCAP|nr:hypothetical protein CCACVL1_11558 [Corchorus capsularis]
MELRTMGNHPMSLFGLSFPIASHRVKNEAKTETL